MGTVQSGLATLGGSGWDVNEGFTGLVPAQYPWASGVIRLDTSGGHMAAHSVVGDITFSATNAKDGGSCMLKITANGTNTPNFSAFTKVGSGSWVNTNAVVNIVQFFRLGGTNYYSVAQAA